MVAYLPPGWPTGVHPPGSEDFERTAVAWLLDVVPPDYRLHGVLQRHPIALATLARRHLAACVEGARQGYRTARTELGGVLPVSGLDAVLAAYRSEGRRLVTTACAADLVERALRGEKFAPQLSPPETQRPKQPTPGTQQPKQPTPGTQRPKQPMPGTQRPKQPTPGKQPTPAKRRMAGAKQQKQPAGGKQRRG